MDEKTARQILEDNRAMHEAAGYANFYDAHLGHIKHPWEQRIFDADLRRIAARLPESFTALDLGAGTGNLSLKLLALGAHVTALDLSLAMLNRLADKAGDASAAIELVCTDVDGYLAKCTDTFHLVAACSFYHHLPDYLTALDRAADRVKPGGFLYFTHEPAHASAASPTANALERLDFLLQRLESRLGLPCAPPRNDPYYDPDSLADYWDLRRGLDHEEIARRLTAKNFDVDMILYDSKRHRLLHTLAKLARTKRLVRVIARRKKPPTENASSPTETPHDQTG